MLTGMKAKATSQFPVLSVAPCMTLGKLLLLFVLHPLSVKKKSLLCLQLDRSSLCYMSSQQKADGDGVLGCSDNSETSWCHPDGH